jgi:hypothetical protein
MGHVGKLLPQNIYAGITDLFGSALHLFVTYFNAIISLEVLAVMASARNHAPVNHAFIRLNVGLNVGTVVRSACRAFND